MKATIALWQDRYAQLSTRERWMVAVGGFALAVTLLYLLIWEPLARSRHQREQDLQGARALAARIESLAVVAQGARGGARTDLSVSLLAAVDQTARTALERPPSRIQPEGEREVKVWIDGVSFDALMEWLQQLQQRYGVQAQSAEIERGSAPGVVNVQLSLVRP